MRRACLALALVALPFAPLASRGTDTRKDADLATDIHKPASPPRPAPKWLKLVDLGKQDKRLAGYRAPEGVKVEVVADAPAVINPVGLAFDDDGTPLVIEWVHDTERPKVVEESFKLKDGSVRKVRAMKKRKKDVIKALSSSKKDGVWDKAKVVLEEELPSTVLPLDGRLYVAGRGSVRRHSRSKAGGDYDTVEVVARGFGGLGQHQVSGLALGPDGRLYISAGDGDNVVEGSDGSRAAALRTGAIFRCEPDGTKLHLFAAGFRNPYRDVSFDLLGNVFHLDNDGGGAARFTGCRLLHVAEGGDYGWRLGIGESGRADPARAAAFGESPGKLPGMLKTGKGSPAGLLIYNDARLPEDYRGLLFYPDAARRSVRAYRVGAKGSSFQVVEEFEFLAAPKDELFRPCQAVLGPDGAIYVVDWRTSSARPDRLCGDGKNGRIYRVSWGGTKDEPALELRGMDSWAKVAKLEDGKLVEALSAPDASDRERARRELVRRGDKNRAALIKLLKDADASLVAKVNAVGALQAMYDDKVRKALLDALADGDDELKRAAADALARCAKKGDEAVQDGLTKALSEEDPAVRRAVFLASGRVAGPGAADGLATALSFDKGADVFLSDAIVRALEMLGKAGMTALMSLADSGVQKDTDRVVEAFLAMRSAEAFAALPALLGHMHVGESRRAELVRSCVNYQLDPPASVDPIVTAVAGRKKEGAEVKKALLAVLATPGVVSGKKADAWARSMLEDGSAEVQKEAVGVAGRTAEGALRAAHLLAARKLPRALLPAVVAALKRHAGESAEAAKALAELEGK